jgi:hypothetical protein
VVLVDEVVFKAHEADREPFEDLGPDGVVLALRGVAMNASVELEDQPERCAVEVDEEAGDDLLAPELEAVDLRPAQQTPGGGFGGGWVFAKAPRERELSGVDGRRPDDTREPLVGGGIDGTVGVVIAHPGSSTEAPLQLRGICTNRVACTGEGVLVTRLDDHDEPGPLAVHHRRG